MADKKPREPLVGYLLLRPCVFQGKHYGRELVGKRHYFRASVDVCHHFMKVGQASEATYGNMVRTDLEVLASNRGLKIAYDTRGFISKADLIELLVSADEQEFGVAAKPQPEPEDEKKKPGRPPKVEPDK